MIFYYFIHFLISKNYSFSNLNPVSFFLKGNNWSINSVHKENLGYENLVCLEELKEKKYFLFIVFRSTLNYKDKIEEMEAEYTIPIATQDGKKFKL